MSIKGIENINGQDVYHDGSDRFQWIGAGIQIPIFTNSRKKIAISQLQVNKKQSEFNFERTLFLNQYQNALNQYLNLKTIADKSTATILPETNRMISVAESKLSAGEIDGVQWVTIVSQSIVAKKQALQSIQNSNEAAIRLQSFIQLK